jgi:hypothetical protein
MLCCGSGINIPVPDFYPSWIPDAGSWILDPTIAAKEGENFFLYYNFLKQQIS